MSQSFRSDLALLGLAVVGVLSDLACVLTGHSAPALFEQIAIAGLTGAAGVALPLRAGSSDPVVPAPAAAAAPAAAVQAPTVAVPYTGPVGQ